MTRLAFKQLPQHVRAVKLAFPCHNSLLLYCNKETTVENLLFQKGFLRYERKTAEHNNPVHQNLFLNIDSLSVLI